MFVFVERQGRKRTRAPICWLTPRTPSTVVSASGQVSTRSPGLGAGPRVCRWSRGQEPELTLALEFRREMQACHLPTGICRAWLHRTLQRRKPLPEEFWGVSWVWICCSSVCVLLSVFSIFSSDFFFLTYWCFRNAWFNFHAFVNFPNFLFCLFVLI